MVTVRASLSASIDLVLGWRDGWALTIDAQSKRRVSSIVLFMRVIVIRELEIGKEHGAEGAIDIGVDAV